MTREPAEALQLPFEARGCDALPALWDAPRGNARRSVFLLGHGAGLDMASDWMNSVAGGLAARGFGVLRFNYPYRVRANAAGKRMAPVDPARVLEAAHACALEELQRRAEGRRVLLAGKSLGARVGSLIAAKGADARGLVLFGYPLHPAGKPEKLRDEHFAAVAQPALFLQGDRDKLCDLKLLGKSLKKYGGHATVEVIPGADHSFHVLKRSGTTDEAVLEAMLERVNRWEAETFPD